MGAAQPAHMHLQRLFRVLLSDRVADIRPQDAQRIERGHDIETGPPDGQAGLPVGDSGRHQSAVRDRLIGGWRHLAP